jgi:hypothetical protein
VGGVFQCGRQSRRILTIHTNMYNTKTHNRQDGICEAE